MGRPRKDFTERDIGQIETLAGYGLSLPQIAAVMGLSEREFETRKNESLVKAALEAGKAKAQGVVGKALYLRAKDGDIAAIRWWEMTRAKRKATQPEGDDGTTAITTKIIIERPDED
jgi:AraC-like DNA-binding protein